MARHYWGYRINTEQIKFFRQELQEGRLRQGWGWDKNQDLRNLKMDKGAKRNLPIFKKVKKGDIILIPHCPIWDEVAIVEASEDFNKGYVFEISTELKDYGHIFPAKFLKSFVRKNQNVSGNLRATLKNVSRFWNIDHCSEEIEKMISLDDSELKDSKSFRASFVNAVEDSFTQAFNMDIFSKKLYELTNDKFSNEEWEFALVEGLKKLLPSPIVVERVGGIKEEEHGADIIIRYPGLLKTEYIVAIQVKDYSGFVGDSPVKQIKKSDTYKDFNDENHKLIDKYVLITNAKKEDNEKLLEKAEDVKIIFAEELKELLCNIGRAYIGLNEN